MGLKILLPISDTGNFALVGKMLKYFFNSVLECQHFYSKDTYHRFNCKGMHVQFYVDQETFKHVAKIVEELK